MTVPPLGPQNPDDAVPDVLGATPVPEPGETDLGDDSILDLSAVAADDAWIEALRTTDPAQLQFSAATISGPVDLSDLMTVWSAELTKQPLPPIPVVEGIALLDGARSRRRGLRSVVLVASSIVALLVGSAVIGSRSATPGDALWPVTRVVWADMAQSVEAGIAVRSAIDEARLALDAGRPEDAIGAFARADAGLSGVSVDDARSALSLDLEFLREQIGTATVVGTATAPPVVIVDTPGATASPVPPPVSTTSAVIPPIATTSTSTSRPPSTAEPVPTGSGTSAVPSSGPTSTSVPGTTPTTATTPTSTPVPSSTDTVPGTTRNTTTVPTTPTSTTPTGSSAPTSSAGTTTSPTASGTGTPTTSTGTGTGSGESVSSTSATSPTTPTGSTTPTETTGATSDTTAGTAGTGGTTGERSGGTVAPTTAVN